MTSRREFLQIGIATASALPLAAQAARAATFGAPTEAPAPPVPLYKVVYDARFPHGAAFARRVSELGVPVHAHRFSESCVNMVRGQPYWRDVGTVDAYWEANLDLTQVVPDLNMYDQDWPIWTCQEQLPPAQQPE